MTALSIGPVLHGILRYEQIPNISFHFQYATLLQQIVTDRAVISAAYRYLLYSALYWLLVTYRSLTVLR